MKKTLLSLSLLVLTNALICDYNITHVQAENQGSRLYMEDHCDIQEYGDWYYFGVFDGHGGEFVSQYLKDNLFRAIRENMKFTSRPYHHTSIPDRLIQSFEQINSQLKKEHLQESLHCGSTAIVALVNKRSGKVYFANTGDSRAVSSLLHTTIDHKPSNKYELSRVGKHNIWKNGIMRLGGSLAMTRSFGDFDLEKYGLIATPEISTFTIDTDHEFLVLATDGIWDILSNEEAIKIVNKRCLNNKLLIQNSWGNVVHHLFSVESKEFNNYYEAQWTKLESKFFKQAHDNQLAIIVNINKEV
jgi:serine/threonine protein phosphatase PrpC